MCFMVDEGFIQWTEKYQMHNILLVLSHLAKRKRCQRYKSDFHSHLSGSNYYYNLDHFGAKCTWNPMFVSVRVHRKLCRQFTQLYVTHLLWQLEEFIDTSSPLLMTILFVDVSMSCITNLILLRNLKNSELILNRVQVTHNREFLSSEFLKLFKIQWNCSSKECVRMLLAKQGCVKKQGLNGQGQISTISHGKHPFSRGLCNRNCDVNIEYSFNLVS